MQEIRRMSKDAQYDMGDRWAIEWCERLCTMDSMRSDLAVRKQVNRVEISFEYVAPAGENECPCFHRVDR